MVCPKLYGASPREWNGYGDAVWAVRAHLPSRRCPLGPRIQRRHMVGDGEENGEDEGGTGRLAGRQVKGHLGGWLRTGRQAGYWRVSVPIGAGWAGLIAGEPRSRGGEGHFRRSGRPRVCRGYWDVVCDSWEPVAVVVCPCIGRAHGRHYNSAVGRMCEIKACRLSLTLSLSFIHTSFYISMVARTQNKKAA